MTNVQLRRVCSWCELVLTEGTPNAQTTHTICRRCHGLDDDGQEIQVEYLRARNAQDAKLA